MKTILTSLISVIATFSFSQVNSAGYVACTGFTEPFHWGRLTDSRAEAMGMTVATTYGNVNTSFYNPAALGTIDAIQVSGTYATPYYLLEDASYLYTGASGKINDYLKVSLSRFAYNENFDFTAFDPGGQSTIEVEGLVHAYTLGIGSEPSENWYFGANLKLIDAGLVKDQRAYTLIGDIGLIKRFELAQTKGHHTVDLGVSMMNFTFNDMNYKALTILDTLDYPAVGLVGVSYGYTTVNKQFKDKLDLLSVKFQGNYVNQLDLDIRNGFRSGLEIGFAEMLYLRCGYYYRTTCDHGYPEYNRGNISSFTYGMGIRAPLKKLTQLPLNVNVDFARIPQPSYVHNVDKEDPFTSVNLRLSWIL